MARVMACAEKVERLMQGLDPGDAMDDSAEDEAPEDDEVRTRSCQDTFAAAPGSCTTAVLQLVGCRLLVVVSAAVCRVGC